MESYSKHCFLAALLNYVFNVQNHEQDSLWIKSCRYQNIVTTHKQDCCFPTHFLQSAFFLIMFPSRFLFLARYAAVVVLNIIMV